MTRTYFAGSDEGLYNFFDDVPEAVDRYEQLIREGQLEEQVGFDYHFIIEHQGSIVGQCQSPAVYLSALAQRTSTIRLATMVFAVPFHNPIRLAMDTAMIDQLSRGRIEVGVGMGPNEYEFKPWNIPFSERRAMFTEAMEVIKKAWTEGCVTYHGKYWNFDNAIALPRPYQKPHPPLWFAGRSRGSLEWAAANSCNLGLFLHPDDQIAEIFHEFRQLCGEAGHNKETMPKTYLFRAVYVADTDEQAYQEIAPFLPHAYTWGEGRYATMPRIGLENPNEDISIRQQRRQIHVGLRSGIGFWLENNLAYVGSPETVIQRIRETQKVTGFNVFGARFRFGAMPDEMVMNSIRRFGEKVIPAFAGLPSGIS